MIQVRTRRDRALFLSGTFVMLLCASLLACGGQTDSREPDQSYLMAHSALWFAEVDSLLDKSDWVEVDLQELPSAPSGEVLDPAKAVARVLEVLDCMRVPVTEPVAARARHGAMFWVVTVHASSSHDTSLKCFLTYPDGRFVAHFGE